MSKYDLQILVCSHRNVCSGTAQCFEYLRQHSKLNYQVIFLNGDALIGRARSLILYQCLYKHPDADYYLFVDDDIIFRPESVEKIYQDLKNGYDVVGGVYPVKGATQISSYTWGGQHEIPLQPNIREVEYLATGFMGISRRILEKVIKELKLPLLNKGEWAECYPLFESGSYTERESGAIYISEDWDFCEKVRKVGGKVYLDTTVLLGHVRDNIYTVKDVYSNRIREHIEQRMQEEQAKAQNKGE